MIPPPNLFQRPDTGLFYLIWYNPDTRRQKWTPLGTRKPSEAKRRERRYVRAWEDGDFDPFGTRRFELDVPSVRTAADTYLEEIDVRPVTKAGYRGVLNLLSESVPAGTRIDSLTPEDFESVIRRPESSAGRATYYRTLRAFSRWTVRRGFCKTAPVDELEAPKKSRGRTAPKFLSRDEFAELETAVDDSLFRELIRFAVGSGLRSKELRFLRFGDVDDELGLIYVQTRRGFETKSGDRTVPLSPLARDAYENRLHAYPRSRVPSEELVFPSPKGGELSRSWTSRRAKHYLRTAGLDEDYHFHTFRHTFASWLRIDGVSLDRIKEWLGHDSITTTEVYAHLAPREARHEILNSFPV